MVYGLDAGGGGGTTAAHGEARRLAAAEKLWGLFRAPCQLPRPQGTGETGLPCGSLPAGYGGNGLTLRERKVSVLLRFGMIVVYIVV